jgi:hypothetical protein
MVNNKMSDSSGPRSFLIVENPLFARTFLFPMAILVRLFNIL